MEKSPPPPPPYKASDPSSAFPTERTSLLSSSQHPNHPPPSYTSFQYPQSIPKARNVSQDQASTRRRARRERRGEERVENRGRGRGRGKVIIAALLIVGLGFSVGCLMKAVYKPVKVPEKVVRVAVIGAGPAGISTAYALSQLQDLPVPVKITVFEEKGGVGGRLFLDTSSSRKSSSSLAASQKMKLNAEDIATGRLLAENSIISQRADQFLGFRKDGGQEGKDVKVGFWDGVEMRSVQTRPIGQGSWSQWFADVKRYGVLVLWNARRLPLGTMRAWRDLLRDASGNRVGGSENGIAGAVAMSARERLQKNGVTGGYVTEIVEPIMRRQFGQSVEEVSDLVLSMGLGREFSSPSSAAQGGRFESIILKFLARSGAEVRLNERVASLKKVVQKDGDRKVEWELQVGSEITTGERFDKIVIATPWNTSSLLSSASEKETEREQIEYRPQYQTIILASAKINATYFGSTAEDLPEQILPIPSSSFGSLHAEMKGIQSITFLRPIYGPDHDHSTSIELLEVEYLYVIASERALELQTIETFWGKGEVKEWRTEVIRDAFPLLYPRSEGFEDLGLGLGGVEVDGEGVWHTGGAEGVASSVDWSWVVGERVAGLVGGKMRGDGGKKI